MLYLDPEFGERVQTIFPTYFSFEDTSQGLEGGFKASASRFDLPLPREAVALSAGALRGARGRGPGRDPRPRGRPRRTCSPPSWPRRATRSRPAPARRSSRSRSRIPEAKREQLLERGVAVRNLPGTPYLRASVGAWNDESDLDRLLAALL